MEHQCDVSVLALDHPSGIPRLSCAVLRRLSEAFDSLDQSVRCRGIVITGKDVSFCAGSDLEEIAALEAISARAFAELGQTLMSRIERYPKPVIAAIRGYCIGGGFDLALACHFRIAAPDASFAHRGATLGIITGWGGMRRLSRLIGVSHSQEIMVTGRTISAPEALQIRIVHRIVAGERLLQSAMEVARRESGGT